MNNEEKLGSTDFDFFIGDWHVAHHQLTRRLADCGEWRQFDGATATRLLLDGMANVDDNVLNHPDGQYRAVTMRSYDPVAGNWSIWWLDGRFPGRLDVPVTGRFESGIGTFFADDVFEGKPIRVRFRWDARDPVAPLWEQAFSPDGGAHWETNWVMRFSRSSAD